jgi:hypothetical protein
MRLAYCPGSGSAVFSGAHIPALRKIAQGFMFDHVRLSNEGSRSGMIVSRRRIAVNPHIFLDE